MHSQLTETHRASLSVAGRVCEVETNFAPPLETLRRSFPRRIAAHAAVDFQLLIRVEGEVRHGAHWGLPFLRGLGHLVFAEFDEENFLLIDLRGRRAVGRFSPDFADDRDLWVRMIMPLVLRVAGPTLGITPLHCACVSRSGRGLVFLGKSGAGKSMLALALAQRGFDFLSDEWTYFSKTDGKLCAWGLPTPLKLLPDAVAFFPPLGAMRPGAASNGELFYEFDPKEVMRTSWADCCEPHWLFFLERSEVSEISGTEISSHEAIARLEADLLLEDSAATESQRKTLETLVGQRCVLLRYGSSPHVVAETLERFINRA